MDLLYRARRRVEFSQTDAAGIMHFAAYFTVMEAAEHEMLRALGLSVMIIDEQGKLSFPRVRAECDFRSAVRFEDELQIDVLLERLGERSVTYVFRMSCEQRPVAEGRVTCVCCRLAADQPPRSTAIPDEFARRIRDAAAKADRR